MSGVTVALFFAQLFTSSELMAKSDLLFLHEEIMLLTLHDEKGTVLTGNYPYAIGGAVLAELLLSGRLRIVEERRKKFVELRSDKPLGDPIVDECLQKVASANRRATVETWVSRFSALRNLMHRVAERLCERGILKADEGKILWIFTRKTYPEINPAPERKLIQRLREAIFTDAKGVDPHTIVLVSLASATDLLHAIFDRKELKPRREHIKQLTNGEISGKAARDVIAAMQAAVAVAAMMPVMMSASSP